MTPSQEKNLIALASAFAEGEPVTAPLHDLLEESGFSAIAAYHFREADDRPFPACAPGNRCDVIDAILSYKQFRNIQAYGLTFEPDLSLIERLQRLEAYHCKARS